MHIVVAVKAVPETGEVKWDEKKGTMLREGIGLVINPYDLHALEQGIRLREVYGGKVTALSMGPLSVKEVLRETIAVGADSAILLSDPGFAGSDTLATSFTLSRAIKKIPEVDLILCGKQAVDGDTAQVGPEIAENLDIPYVTYVRKIEEIQDGKIKVERLMENGYQIIEIPMPGLLTVVKEINEPRFPTLKGKIKAKNTEIETWNITSLESVPMHSYGATQRGTGYGQKGSPTQVIRIFTPEARSSGEIFTGTPEDQVKALATQLKKKEIIQCPSK